MIAGLKRRLGKSGKENSEKSLLVKTLVAGSIGISLLGLIYSGFSYVSAFYSTQLAAVEPDALISAVSYYTLGPLAGLFTCIAVSLACLTTAIALSVVFTDYMRTKLFANKINYNSALLITTVITFAFSNIGFSGIMRLIVPILFVCYPALIVLAVLNIAYKLWDVQLVKVPVFGTFAAVLLYRLYNLFV